MCEEENKGTTPSAGCGTPLVMVLRKVTILLSSGYHNICSGKVDFSSIAPSNKQ